MIAISEMMKPAVWKDWADAYRVCMTIRSTAKFVAMVVPDNNGNGYCIRTFSAKWAGEGQTLVTMGLVAALCARHDLPPDDPKAKQFYGPRFDNFPFFKDGLPKEPPLQLDGPLYIE